jgi:hypothetical protein
LLARNGAVRAQKTKFPRSLSLPSVIKKVLTHSEATPACLGGFGTLIIGAAGTGIFGSLRVFGSFGSLGVRIQLAMDQSTSLQVN